MKQSSKRMRLTEDPVGPSIISLMLPMIWGMAALTSYSLADTFFVAQIGTMELAAVSFTFPVTFVVGAMAMGLGIGTSSIVSRLFGSGQREEIQRLTTHAVLLGVVFGLGIIVLGLNTIDPVFTLLGADAKTLPYIHEYISIYYWGGIFTVIPMIGSAVMRSSGDPKTPAKIMLASAVFNFVLDPILIFGLLGAPKLGLQGAAIATVLAGVLTAFTSIGFIYFRDHLIRFRASDFALIFDSWRRILHVGIPSMTSSMIVPLTTAFITWQVSQFGQEAVAGFGVASRIEGMSMLAVMALGASIPPFVGQNFGAQKYDRVSAAMNFVYRFGLIYGLTVATILFFASDTIAGWFSQDQVALNTAHMHLSLVPWSYAFLTASACSVSAFNAIGKPLPGMLVSMTRTVAVYAPMAFLLASWLGIRGVFLAAFLANIVAGSLGFFWFRKTFKSYRNPVPAAPAQTA